MRTYALGDLHGNDVALLDVLAKAQFNFQRDKLIFLGDLADGWGNYDKCLEIFSRINNFVPIIGNHDYHLMKYIKSRYIDKKWLKIGGDKTLMKLHQSPKLVDSLRHYFSSAVYYYIYDNTFFVHGGINHNKPLKKQRKYYFCKNRKMWQVAAIYNQKGMKFAIEDVPDVQQFFVGHNTTQKSTPEQRSNIINIDTGCGSNGCLTIINTNTKEYYQSSLKPKIITH